MTAITTRAMMVLGSLTAVLFWNAHVVQATSATMYWDCCKPSGAWLKKASVYKPVDVCDHTGRNLITGTEPQSGCGGGPGFQCSCQQPWTDSVDLTLGYAFTAWPSNWPGSTPAQAEEETECGCYLVEFEGSKAGKINKLFFQVINNGGDLVLGSFDILVPGMGVGAMTQGCPNQWKTDMRGWGKQYGGVDQDAKACANLPVDLQRGCNWKFTDWGGSTQLKGPPRRVRCSKGHINRSGCQRTDDQHQPIYDSRTDAEGLPAPDQYQRDLAVCGYSQASQHPLAIENQPLANTHHSHANKHRSHANKHHSRRTKHDKHH